MPAADTMHAIVRRATLAPSSHNTQPWRFRAASSTIDLIADRTRALRVNDPFDRELSISCGAALMTLRAAAAGAGLGTRAHVLPDGPHSDWLARVEITSEPADADLAGLAGFIEQRRTYRKAFDGREVGPDTLAAISVAASIEGAGLVILDDEQRRMAGQLVAEGDRLQWDDPRWRRELAMWMHSRRQGDGLALSALAAPIARAVVRTFDMGNGVAARDHQLLAASPCLTVLTTALDDVRAWLHAGQALQRALLEGCRHGVQASYLNQPVEVPALRVRLRSVLRTADHPQLLLRWGYPTAAVPPAPRRSLDAVLEAAAAGMPQAGRSH